MPIVKALKNPDFLEEHKTAINEIVGYPLTTGKFILILN